MLESYWHLTQIPPLLVVDKDNNDDRDIVIDYQLDDKMKESLIKHLFFVNSTVSNLVDSYKNCDNSNYFESDLFYRFILDLLGHKQDKIIFQKKIESDLESERTVSIYIKVTCVLLILGLNIFFCFYSILKGYNKGLEWQYQYLNLCVFQLLTEVLVFSSVECVLLHFTFPSLASVRFVVVVLINIF
jgi:hypothetical protein